MMQAAVAKGWHRSGAPARRRHLAGAGALARLSDGDLARLRAEVTPRQAPPKRR